MITAAEARVEKEIRKWRRICRGVQREVGEHVNGRGDR
jgi:hypothetical protein